MEESRTAVVNNGGGGVEERFRARIGIGGCALRRGETVTVWDGAMDPELGVVKVTT